MLKNAVESQLSFVAQELLTTISVTTRDRSAANPGCCPGLRLSVLGFALQVAKLRLSPVFNLQAAILIEFIVASRKSIQLRGQELDVLYVQGYYEISILKQPNSL